MPILQVTYGNETFSNPGKSCRVQLFYRPSLQAEDVPLVNAMYNEKSGAKKHNLNSIPASALNVHHGNWTEATIEVPEGAGLSVLVTKTGTAGFGATRFALMLLARADAPLHRLAVELTRHPKAEKGEAYIEGRFDIIKYSDFERLGVRVDKNFVNQFDSDWEDYVDVSVLDKMIAPLAAPELRRIETAKGKTVLLKRTNRRRIKL